MAMTLQLFIICGLYTATLSSAACVPGFYYDEHVPEDRRDCTKWIPCPRGSYCTGDGMKNSCPAGTIGNRENLSSDSCNGPCPPGYFCPEGSALGVACGTGHGQYCPLGSSSPAIAAIGFYTTPDHQELSLGIRGGAEFQSGVKICEAGSYCPGDGTARLCVGGSYGSAEGLTTMNCSGLCLGGYYCPPGSTSPSEYPCTHMQSSDKHAASYCPRGSDKPIPTRLGFYASYEGDPQREESLANDGVSAYIGDSATIAISFNITTSSHPTSDRRASLKANIAHNLLKMEETHIGRFGVVPLHKSINVGSSTMASDKGSRFGWAVRFEATHSVSSAGYGTASKWKDGVKATLVSKPYILNDGSLLVNTVVDTDSVRGVVAGRRTMSWNSINSDVDGLLQSNEPALWHSSVPIILQFNITAIVPKLDDISCVLPSSKAASLKTALLSVLKLEENERQENLLKPGQYQVRTVSRVRKHRKYGFNGEAYEHVGHDGSIGKWSVEVTWAVSMEIAYPPSIDLRDDQFLNSVLLLPLDNDLPANSMGWKGNTQGLKDGFGYSALYGDGTGSEGGGFSDLSRMDSTRSTTRVNIMERWAAAAHNALAGPQFQALTVEALKASSTQDTASSSEPLNITVDLGSISVTSSAAWAGQEWHHGITELKVLDFNGEVHSSEAFQEAVKFDRKGGFAFEHPCPAGSYCMNGVKSYCPAGRYGARERSYDMHCDGDCHAGYYCPLGSISPNQVHCGLRGNSSVYCPVRSAYPVKAPPGYYTYSDTGSRQASKPWAQVDIDQDGYLSWDEFKASLSDDMEQSRKLWTLADKDQSQRLDPLEYSTIVTLLGPHGDAARSGHKFIVHPFNHAPKGVAMNMSQYGDAHFSYHTIETRTNIALCDPGHYCIEGVRYQCPRGVYGAAYGLVSSQCSGACSPGYFCPEESTTSFGASTVTDPRRSDQPCGNDTVFCPARSRYPQSVGVGFYTTGGLYDGSTRSGEHRCEPGSYCVRGVKRPCLAGFYGESFGETDPKCSGLCSAGFYCPIGSTKSEEFPCGDPSQVCPEGSALPQQVDLGRYSVNGVCEDVWPPRLRSLVVEQPRRGVAVLTADELQQVLQHESWMPGNTWTIQVVVSSSCSQPIRFGFAYGEGTLLFTVPALAVNELIRVSDEVSVVREPRSSQFQAFDTCHKTVEGEDASGTSVTFHEVRLGSGVCPGFDSPAFGACRETTWTQHMDFTDSAFRTEDTANIKSGDIRFLARTVENAPSQPSKPLLKLNYFSDVPYVSQIVEPLTNMLINRTWHPCSTGQENKTESMDMSYHLGRVVYDDSRVGVWVLGEATWWKHESNWVKTNVNGKEGNTFSTQANLTQPWPKPLHASQSLGGVVRRTTVSIAPKGHFASRGLLYECPAGQYGDKLGEHNSECSGCCEAGYYCPPASIHPRQIPCGGTDRFCPRCSPHPIPVFRGYYTSTVETEACPPGTWRNLTQLVDPTLNPDTNQQSELTSASLSTSVAHDTFWGSGDVNSASSGRGDGAGDDWALGPLPPCVLCPVGKYKASTGDGYHLCLECDDATTSGVSTEDNVGCVCKRAPGGGVFDALRFVPETGACEAVDPINATNEGASSLRNSTLTRFEQHPCEKGFYCQFGVRHVCPSTRFGSSELETSPLCSGVCAAGYFCPEGSTSANQFPCGGSDRYCPPGSDTPLKVRVGFYTNEDRHEDIRVSESICPKGYWCEDGIRHVCAGGLWGGEEGLSTSECSGECAAGYYCPEGSTSPRQHKCGNSTVFCPPKSAAPTPLIMEGFYGTHAEPYEGRQALRDPLNETLSAQLPCERGYWCSKGIKHPCRAGYFGWAFGASSDSCSGKCSAGYRCPSTSTQAKEMECAEGFNEPAVTFFCPPGTTDIGPKRVRSGYYTVGGGPLNRTRTNEVKCEQGYWCAGGIKQPCPAGSYGRTKGLTSARCSGVCPAGFACPEATIEPVKCLPGTYSTGSAKKCTQCPGAQPRGQSCVDSRHCCGF